MRHAIFLGCVVPARSRNYEMAARAIAREFGLELVDIPEFSCCGFPIMSSDRDLGLLLGAMNLALAEENGLDICTLCSACTSHLLDIKLRLEQDLSLLKYVNNRLSKVGKRYSGKVEVRHMARILYQEIGLERIKEKVRINLEPLTVASHYGCHYLRPTEIVNGFEDPRFPHTLDEMVMAVGARPLDYDGALECCGGPVLPVDEDTSFAIAVKKLSNIKEKGADAITLVCPFCNLMFDNNQKSLEKRYNIQYQIPVLYLPQLLGLALGIDPKEIGLNLNSVKANRLMELIGVMP